MEMDTAWTKKTVPLISKTALPEQVKKPRGNWHVLRRCTGLEQTEENS